MDMITQIPLRVFEVETKTRNLWTRDTRQTRMDEIVLLTVWRKTNDPKQQRIDIADEDKHVPDP